MDEPKNKNSTVVTKKHTFLVFLVYIVALVGLSGGCLWLVAAYHIDVFEAVRVILWLLADLLGHAHFE